MADLRGRSSSRSRNIHFGKSRRPKRWSVGLINPQTTSLPSLDRLLCEVTISQTTIVALQRQRKKGRGRGDRVRACDCTNKLDCLYFTPTTDCTTARTPGFLFWSLISVTTNKIGKPPSSRCSNTYRGHEWWWWWIHLPNVVQSFFHAYRFSIVYRDVLACI